MMYYIKDSIEILRSGNTDKNLVLAAILTIKPRLKVLSSYIKECESKGFIPFKELLDEYNLLDDLYKKETVKSLN